MVRGVKVVGIVARQEKKGNAEEVMDKRKVEITKRSERRKSK
jgi:hypothetical protein